MLSEQNKVVMYNAPLALEQAPRRLMVTKFTAPKIVADEELAEPCNQPAILGAPLRRKRCHLSSLEKFQRNSLLHP